MKRINGFTIPERYSNQGFDEIQHRAQVLTDEDRAAGLPAPQYGYSAKNIIQAQAERRAAIEQYDAEAMNPANWKGE